MNRFEQQIAGEDKNWTLTILFYTVAVIGTYTLLACLLRPLFTCCKYKCVSRQDLNKKYGRADNSAYAVVTGGSDGIGLEMCHQLAEQGFNICMVSRNKSKVDAKLQEISEKYPKC